MIQVDNTMGGMMLVMGGVGRPGCGWGGVVKRDVLGII